MIITTAIMIFCAGSFSENQNRQLHDIGIKVALPKTGTEEIMKYQTVILDMDGTTVDTSEGIIKSIRYTMEQMKRPQLPPDVERKFIGPVLSQAFSKFCHMNEQETAQAIHIYRSRYETKGIYEARAFDGMESMLQNLKNKGCKLGIASMKFKPFVLFALKHFHIDCYFDYIAAPGEYTQLTKAQLIEEAMEKTTSSPETTVMIGDSAGDAIGARDAGVDFIGVYYGGGFNNAEEIMQFPHVLATANVAEMEEFLLK